MMRGGSDGLVHAVLTGSVVVVLLAPAFVDGPPPAHTGGFGEPTCQQCHFGAPLDAPGGSLHVEGLPAEYVPGKAYPLVVHLDRSGMQQGGIQLSVRYADGPTRGEQAGSLAAEGRELAVDHDQGVAYLRHTPDGAALHAPDSARWAFNWKAPDSAAAAIVVHAAGNAADGDGSAFGDHIYTFEAKMP